MAAADSATRIDPSVDEATGSTPARRSGKRSGASAKTGTTRSRGASATKGAPAKTAAKSAKKAADPAAEGEPTELDGEV